MTAKDIHQRDVLAVLVRGGMLKITKVFFSKISDTTVRECGNLLKFYDRKHLIVLNF